ncbi:hypothetical protein GGR58DRAFT_179939 [Xylaria digitata]|nr:hypothetical protein GGR58DRAFT_179939 [Xylaria digitata]
MFGPRFYSADLFGYKIMRSLGSQDLNAESVNLQVLRMAINHYFFSSSKPSQTIVSSPLLEEIEPYLAPPPDGIPLKVRPADKSKHVAHIWSFTSVGEPWVLSIPVMAVILGLMLHPARPKPPPGEVSYDDRDISWCIDSLQRFCRLDPPLCGERDMFFSLGTYGDCAMYLSFILTFYKVKDHDIDDVMAQASKFSGLLCDRAEHKTFAHGTFREGRILVTARVAAGHAGMSYASSPRAIGVILTDISHQPINATASDYEERGLDVNAETSGVTLFLNMVWNHFDLWRDIWTRCLDHVARHAQLKFTQLETREALHVEFPQYNTFHSTDKYIQSVATTELLGIFRREIATGPEALKQMKKKWTMTYRGAYSENTARFNRSSQKLAIEN